MAVARICRRCASRPASNLPRQSPNWRQFGLFAVRRLGKSLDEIGDMPLGMQTRLLRVLQERSVTPVGAGKAVDMDFALVCATHCTLREEADQGRFRSDLYYRINGLTVLLPALRERTDFQALTDRLLASLNPGRDIHLATDVLARLSQHPWPGNLRQYASMLRTASAMLRTDEACIDWPHLPDDLTEDLLASAQPVAHHCAMRSRRWHRAQRCRRRNRPRRRPSLSSRCRCRPSAQRTIYGQC